MTLVRNAAYRAFRALGLGSLLRKRRAGAIVLCYHNVVRARSVLGGQGIHLARDDFAAQMDWLATRSDVVPLAVLLQRVREGSSVKGLAAVTFDDGYRGVLEQALPVLSRLRLPATLFVTVEGAERGHQFWWDHSRFRSIVDDAAARDRLLVDEQGDRSRIMGTLSLREEPLDREMLPADWAALRGVGPDIAIEAHTVSHRTLTQLDDAALDHELVTGADAIMEQLGRRPTSIAYPYGRFDDRVRAATKRAGYVAGVTLEEHDLVLGADPFAVPRLGIPAGLGLDTFAVWVSGMAHIRSSKLLR